MVGWYALRAKQRAAAQIFLAAVQLSEKASVAP